ncbi:Rpn family recombination-promoting nuclease/putative transposase [Thauera mechernichensis]
MQSPTSCTPATMPAHHDTGYKLLFSDPLMVRDLLLGFVDDPWLARLDFSTLELVNSHYVSEDLRNRADDVVWRVRADERWVYLYLLIEFQSSVDRFMALRMLVYVGLLYQDLVRDAQSRIRHRTSADRHLATCRLAAEPQIPHPSPRAR